MEVVVRNTDDCLANLMGKVGIIEHLIISTTLGKSEDIAYNIKNENFILNILVNPEFIEKTIKIGDNNVEYKIHFKVRIEEHVYILTPMSIFPSETFCMENLSLNYLKKSNKDKYRSIW